MCNATLTINNGGCGIDRGCGCVVECVCFSHSRLYTSALNTGHEMFGMLDRLFSYSILMNAFHTGPNLCKICNKMQWHALIVSHSYFQNPLNWSVYEWITYMFGSQWGYLKMDKGYPPQQSAPPYPGPPLNYGGPEMYPQPGYAPPAAPPGAYHGGLCPRLKLRHDILPLIQNHWSTLLEYLSALLKLNITISHLLCEDETQVACKQPMWKYQITTNELCAKVVMVMVLWWFMEICNKPTIYSCF